MLASRLDCVGSNHPKPRLFPVSESKIAAKFQTETLPEKALQQRRRQIVQDSHQLKLDVDHFNSIHPDEEQLALILDFTDDVKEMMIAEGIEDEEAA